MPGSQLSDAARATRMAALAIDVRSFRACFTLRAAIFRSIGNETRTIRVSALFSFFDSHDDPFRSVELKGWVAIF
jgi:hypothetical protein